MSEQRKTKNRGRDNERSLAEKLQAMGHKAKRVPLSGALKDLPGDVTDETISTLFEAKVYAVTEVEGARYVKFDLNWIPKIQAEAKRAGYEYGVVAVRGKNLQQTYVTMTLEDYVRMREQGKD